MNEAQPAAIGEPEVHRADPAERRRTLVMLALVALFGVFLIAGMQHELDGIRDRIASGDTEDAAARFVWMARASFVMLALVGLATAAVVARGALAVIAEQRYPHASARLLRDRRVMRGQPAVLMGRLGLLLAAAFAVVGCVGAVVGWKLLELFA